MELSFSVADWKLCMLLELKRVVMCGPSLSLVELQFLTLCTIVYLSGVAIVLSRLSVRVVAKIMLLCVCSYVGWLQYTSYGIMSAQEQ